MLRSFCWAVAVLVSAAVAAPTQIQARDGPSGKLIKPFGGQVITDPGSFELTYKPVDETDYQTISIQATLESPEGYENVILNAFRGNNKTSNDWHAFLVTPFAVCGTYQVLVFETQLTPTGAITFQSAAPTVFFECDDGTAPNYPPPGDPTHYAPHGDLLSPVFSHTYSNVGPFPAPFNFKYSTFHLDGIDTISVWAELDQGGPGSGVSYDLFISLLPKRFGKAKNIDYWFVPPSPYACGMFNFTVYETQSYYGTNITFQSAQAEILFLCE